MGDGGGGGVKNIEKLADIVCEQSLSLNLDKFLAWVYVAWHAWCFLYLFESGISVNAARMLSYVISDIRCINGCLKRF